MVYFLGKRMPIDVTVAVVAENENVIKEYSTKRLSQTLFVFTPDGKFSFVSCKTTKLLNYRSFVFLFSHIQVII